MDALNYRSTAPTAGECQSFLDKIVAQFGLSRAQSDADKAFTAEADLANWCGATCQVLAKKLTSRRALVGKLQKANKSAPLTSVIG
jgi:hypothetical protein